jgi:hypothetical protein
LAAILLIIIVPNLGEAERKSKVSDRNNVWYSEDIQDYLGMTIEEIETKG